MNLNTAKRLRSLTRAEWLAEYQEIEQDYIRAETAEKWHRVDRLGDLLSFYETHQPESLDTPFFMLTQPEGEASRPPQQKPLFS
jgi:hypothetical protein